MTRWWAQTNLAMAVWLCEPGQNAFSDNVLWNFVSGINKRFCLKRATKSNDKQGVERIGGWGKE